MEKIMVCGGGRWRVEEFIGLFEYMVKRDLLQRIK